MSTFNLKIVTPQGLAYDDECEKLIVKTTEGEAGILPKHINYIAALSTGRLKLVAGNTEKIAAVSGGFIEVSKTHTNVIVTSFEWAEDIDIKRAERAKQVLEEKLKSSLSENEQKMAEVALKKAINRLKIAKK